MTREARPVSFEPEQRFVSASWRPRTRKFGICALVAGGLSWNSEAHAFLRDARSNLTGRLRVNLGLASMIGDSGDQRGVPGR
jgi:hypothetical protein